MLDRNGDGDRHTEGQTELVTQGRPEFRGVFYCVRRQDLQLWRRAASNQGAFQQVCGYHPVSRQHLQRLSEKLLLPESWLRGLRGPRGNEVGARQRECGVAIRAQVMIFPQFVEKGIYRDPFRFEGLDGPLE